jgi:hypothetical protein
MHDRCFAYDARPGASGRCQAGWNPWSILAGYNPEAVVLNLTYLEGVTAQIIAAQLEVESVHEDGGVHSVVPQAVNRAHEAMRRLSAAWGP